MVLERFRKWMRGRAAGAPEERLRRFLAELPEEAFMLEGMNYSRADVEEWLDMGELEVLLGVLAGIAAEYEEQRGSLPQESWRELRLASEQLGMIEVVAPFLRETGGQSDAAESAALGVQARFLQDVDSGVYRAMRDAGCSAAGVAVAAVRAGAVDLHAVRVVRELFGLGHADAVAIVREARAVAAKPDNPSR